MHVSVVIPCYRQSGWIENLAKEILLWANISGVTLQLILVDDSNQLGLRHMVRKLAIENTEITSIVLSRNFGQAAATICGLSNANGDLVVTMDDDTHNSALLLDEMLSSHKSFPEADILHFLPLGDSRPSMRKLGSSIIQKSQNIIINKNSNLTFSSTRLMKGFVAAGVRDLNFSHPVVNPILSQISTNQETIGLSMSIKKSVKSSYSQKKLLSLALSNFFSFNALPLKLLGAMGLVGAPLAATFGLVLFVVRIANPEFGGDGFTTISILLLGSLAINLIAFGIIGMHLERIQASVSAGASYYVREIID